MAVLDPTLKFLRAEATEAVARLGELEGAAAAGLDLKAAKPTVKVLVQFTGDIGTLEKAGFKTRTVAGDVASGVMTLDAVEKVSKLPEVVRLELTRPLSADLDVSVPEIRADLVHSGPPGNRGSGVLIGIIDSGIDIMHQSFRRTDGTSRVLSIWDQNLTPAAGESNPAGFAYGVEYNGTNILASIAAGGPPNVVRHMDADADTGHGTHVSGIAAGDGSAPGNGRPAFTFVGVAPEADLIVVANDAFGGGGRGMGDSANTLDAVNYIFNRAAALNRPVVINQSQGDNIGAHDGSSLLERGIDNLLGGAGRIMVKSAGNEGDRSRHASGMVALGGTQNLRFNAPGSNSWPDVIDIWYDGPDRFSVSVSSPDGNTSAAVNPGTTTTLTLANNNRVFVDSTVSNPINNDNRIFIRFDRGAAATIQAGAWSLNLIGLAVTNGRFDAWIDRNIPPVPTFTSHVDAQMTLSIPGTSMEIITAGSYITSGAGVGALSSFSSRGPTRDGRASPTISAPGQWITSARANGIASGTGVYHALPGTSMAAPHVTGVVALMLEVNRNLTQAQVRSCLANNARSDAFTGAVPNTSWGAGKIDAQAAVNCARLPKLKFADDPVTLKFSDDPKLKFNDDPITTLKFRDDKLKFADDPVTLKFSDDPKLKFNDDPITTLKFRDDPKLKFGDDPRIDPVKQPGLDKQPGTDGRSFDPSNPVINPGRVAGVAGPRGPESAAPFVMSTPHHSNAWAGSYPEAHQQALAQLEATIRSYEEHLEMAVASEGRLTEEQMRQTEAFHEEYQRLVQQYRQMTGQ